MGNSASPTNCKETVTLSFAYRLLSASGVDGYVPLR
jgi:hypothetical protein